MSDSFEPAIIPLVDVETVKGEFESAQLGDWFWYQSKDEGSKPSLMCAMQIGSNYIELHTPHANGYSSVRVHRDDVADLLKPEPDASRYINERINYYSKRIQDNLTDIQRLTQSLGLTPQIGHGVHADNKGLAVLSGQVDVNAFKQELLLAKEKTLPDLFELNKKLSQELSRWMCAPSMALQSKLAPLEDSVKGIKDRIFNIELYSGLLEDVIEVASGEPACIDEKLHIMQRRLYMDEECLLSYEAGGMEFEDIHKFNAWLAKPENRDRILPFPRCMVSMRVRRDVKDRLFYNGELDPYVRFQHSISDKYTYLFMRNGEQIYLISTGIEFGELIFPDQSVFNPSEPLVFKMYSHVKVDKFMPRREFESVLEDQARQAALSKQWEQENPKDVWEAANPDSSWSYANPYRSHRMDWLSEKSWHSFDDTSVYYDQALAHIQAEVKEYNRIALVVQGIFDRTSMLAPHHPVKIWQPESFQKAVELVYDGTGILYHGEAPDIESYIRECNAKVTRDSVMHGQDDAWAKREAERENRRTENNWRVRSEHKIYHTRLRPYGDPGPGLLAFMSEWKPRSKTATFTWVRDRRNARSYGDDSVKSSISVPLGRLFNVSAYKRGDFKRFFQDPRTRAQYLKWAPMLLAAEEFHAGNHKVNKPVE